MQIGARRDKLTFFIISKPLLALQKEKKIMYIIVNGGRGQMHHALAFLEILMIFFMTPQTAADTGHSFFDFYLAQKGVCVFHLHNDNIQLVLKYCYNSNWMNSPFIYSLMRKLDLWSFFTFQFNCIITTSPQTLI